MNHGVGLDVEGLRVRTKQLGFVLLGLLAPSLAAHAPAQAPPLKPGTALVSGRVLDAIDSSPVDEAIVTMELQSTDGRSEPANRRQLTDLDLEDLYRPAFLDSLVQQALRVTIQEGQRLRQDLRIAR